MQEVQGMCVKLFSEGSQPRCLMEAFRATIHSHAHLYICEICTSGVIKEQYSRRVNGITHLLIRVSHAVPWLQFDLIGRKRKVAACNEDPLLLVLVQDGGQIMLHQRLLQLRYCEAELPVQHKLFQVTEAPAEGPTQVTANTWAHSEHFN